MSISTKKTTIALAASVAMTAGLALSPTLASADTANPFASTELSSGYMQVAEGKCGGEMKKDAEAKCGANKAATETEKKVEGKCGEAKCGANKKAAMEAKAKAAAEADKAGEAKCGANKKSEGSCGAKK